MTQVPQSAGNEDGLVAGPLLGDLEVDGRR